MKFKALRTKREPKEFVEICFHRSDVDPNEGVWVVYTGELPNPQPVSADTELMKAYYSQQSVPLPEDINLDDYELVEFEAFEADIVGADIRNKLTPPKNLVSLLEIYFKEKDESKLYHLKRFIKTEMKNSKKNIKYIAGLL
jgi:hypothetical protein